MPVIKNLKKKGVTILPKVKGKSKPSNGQKANKSKPSGAAGNNSNNNKASSKKRTSGKSVDAWDTGFKERVEYEKAVKAGDETSKRLRVDFAPATLVLPSAEDNLRKRMGEFAGPLLGALWEEKPRTDTVSFEPRKEAPPASKRNANKFAALASDSEDESNKPTSGPRSERKAIPDFKPALLNLEARAGIQVPISASKKDLFEFKPSILDANASATSTNANSVFSAFEFKPSGLQLDSNPPAASPSSSTFEFKPPSLQLDNSLAPSANPSSFQWTVPTGTTISFGGGVNAPTAPAEANKDDDWDDL